jgi:hypothetical protein
MLIENRDITPAPNFAGKKASGHTLLTALKDNLDNHFDSESSVIKLFLAPDLENPKKTVLISLDFGTGIPSDRIHKMYVDNHSTKNGGMNRWTINRKRRNLGRFGNGMKNVVSRLGGNVLTISKLESDCIHAVDYNPSKIEITQEYSATVYRIEYGTSEPMIETLRKYWTTYMIDEEGSHINHGTMNVFKNVNSEILSQLKRKLNYEPFNIKSSFGAVFGETFEQFLNEGDKLYIGTDFKKLVEVLPLSPFSGGKEYSKEIFSYTRTINGVDEVIEVPVTFYRWERGDIHYRPLTQPNAGVYINRNGRLHLTKKEQPISTELPETTIEELKSDADVIWNNNTAWNAFCTSHSRFALIRVKVDMTSDLDDAFGVNNVKTEMSLTSELDKLAQCIFKTVRKMDPFKGNGTSSPDERFARYACNKVNKKHVRQALENTLSEFLHDPESLRVSKDIISKFTSQLGQDVTII